VALEPKVITVHHTFGASIYIQLKDQIIGYIRLIGLLVKYLVVQSDEWSKGWSNNRLKDIGSSG